MRPFTLLPWLLFLPLAALAAPAAGPQGPHGPPPHAQLVERADELGLSPEVVARVEAIADDAEPELEVLAEVLHEAHDALREALSAEPPSRARVLAASRAVGEAEQALRDRHLEVELDLRAALTPEQWAAVAPKGPPPGFGPPPGHGPPPGRGGACPPPPGGR